MALALLDRDGTLNRERSFVTDPDQLVVLPGVPAAIQRLAAAGYTPVVVTSQSGIARGLYSPATLARIHDKLQRACGGAIRAFFHCPHHPELDGPYGGACPCRKPAPGLLHRAAEVLGTALDGGVLVGDSARDLLMGRNLRLTRVLVRTGKPWAAQQAELDAASVPPHFVADDLGAAVDWILGPGTQANGAQAGGGISPHHP